MYYNKLENEEELYLNTKSILLKENNKEDIILILTNKRLIILIDIENNNEYKILLEKSRGRKVEEKYINMEFNINDFLRVEVLKDRQLFILKTKNVLILDDIKLVEKIKDYLEITYA